MASAKCIERLRDIYLQPSVPIGKGQIETWRSNEDGNGREMAPCGELKRVTRRLSLMQAQLIIFVNPTYRWQKARILQGPIKLLISRISQRLKRLSLQIEAATRQSLRSPGKGARASVGNGLCWVYGRSMIDITAPGNYSYGPKHAPSVVILRRLRRTLTSVGSMAPPALSWKLLWVYLL